MEADGNWLLESDNGIEFGGGLVSMTLRDYGRFGTFILVDGIINNEAMLPQGWLQEIGAVPFDAPQCACGNLYSENNAGEYAYSYPLGYSYNWWPLPTQSWGNWDYLNEPLWWGADAIDATPPNFNNLLGTTTAQGIFGQFIHINKEENMVSIVLSTWETPWIDPKEYETYSFLNAATDALK
jgi:CubicO group peptidase (beta-lactamase class C family)